MNQATAKRLEALAPQFEKFLALHPDEQDWLYLLLGRAERRTIDILQIIAGNYLSYEEIATKCDCHPTTVKITLYALQAGGLPLDSDKTERWISPKGGRYRAIKKIGDAEK